MKTKTLIQLMLFFAIIVSSISVTHFISRKLVNKEWIESFTNLKYTYETPVIYTLKSNGWEINEQQILKDSIIRSVPDSVLKNLIFVRVTDHTCADCAIGLLKHINNYRLPNQIQLFLLTGPALKEKMVQALRFLEMKSQIICISEDSSTIPADSLGLPYIFRIERDKQLIVRDLYIPQEQNPNITTYLNGLLRINTKPISIPSIH